MHQIQFSILKDVVTVMLDTSGPGLHKRGYRQNSNAAPIKETLASGIIDLAHVKPFSTVYDPFCGSGTFLIESATKALKDVYKRQVLPYLLLLALLHLRLE